MTDRLCDVAHTPPHEADTPAQRRYRRGPIALTDGGGREEPPDAADGPAAESDDTEPTLQDVDHTPPDGDDLTRVYRRGRDPE